MVTSGVRLSYRQLGELASVLARQLAQAGITHADPIALYSDNQPEFVIALVAAWTAGAAVVPIDPQLAPAEIAARLAAVSAGAVLVPHRLRDSYPAQAGATPAWSVDIGPTNFPSWS